MDATSGRWLRGELVLAMMAVMTSAGCGPGTGMTGESSGSTGSTGDGTTGDATDPTTPTDPTAPTDPTTPTSDPDPTGEPPPVERVSLQINDDVDLLFVIDNSGSMAEEQALLAQHIAALIDPLEAAGANYRVGVTTTDSGNPRCGGGTPEGGNLVLSSCVDRVAQGEFMFAGEDFSAACTGVCSKSDADLVVRATTTHYDSEEKPRKWIERIEGQSNIDGASVLEALQCYLPQGVAGCGFESHLESMYLALANATSSASANNYGFLRESAQLAIVIVSDETDCSYNPMTKEIFTTNKVFWNDPSDPAPTSAVCWRAGVACTGAGPTYSECHAENRDIDGQPTDDPSKAALQPVRKYIDFVRSIESDKQLLDPAQRVKVSLITGVPVGYEDFNSEIGYEDAPNTDFQVNFGIGPGCVVGDPDLPETAAVPPVREREFAEAFVLDDAHRNLYSICQADYSASLAAIGEELAEAIVPTCMPGCVADKDPETPVLDPNCQLYEDNIALATSVPIAPCAEVNGAWTPPAGQTVCFAQRVDKDGFQTPSKIDDMSPLCVDEGFNLEFDIIRTASAVAGVTISAVCELSESKAQDCPNL